MTRSNLRRPRRRRRPLLFLILIAAVALAFFGRQAITPSEARIAPIAEAPAFPPEIRNEIHRGIVNPGDTLTSILQEHLSPGEIHTLTLESRQIFPLSRICAGQGYKLCLVDGAFDRFEYDIDRNDLLIISKKEDGYEVSRNPIPYTVETGIVRGTITTNLFDAVTGIGESPELAVALSDIFAWDIDFILDIRVGDSFQAVVEKRYRDGEPAGYANLLAAEFTNQGTTYKAFLFGDGDRPPAYYDEEGKSLRKAFLRAPLSFTRISSGFTMKRYHPITKTWKAHPAIDYAAPTGTPIKSVGDGTIKEIGRTKYNGNYIKIRHTGSYETLYLHMNGFARKLKKGTKVTQGQTIGYVGSTGLATGPHLCFRMYKNGSPVNPNRIREKAAPPISSKNMDAFRLAIAPLVAQLEGRDVMEAALQNPSPSTP